MEPKTKVIDFVRPNWPEKYARTGDLRSGDFGPQALLYQRGNKSFYRAAEPGELFNEPGAQIAVRLAR